VRNNYAEQQPLSFDVDNYPERNVRENVRIVMQDYKFLHVAVMIFATLVNTRETDSLFSSLTELTQLSVAG